MLKITSADTQNGHHVLRLEGRLAEQWVDEVSTVASGIAGALVLDLSGLTFIDARGVTLLQDLDERGARLVGGSVFITTLIGRGTR